jgi:hypothetical protein
VAAALRERKRPPRRRQRPDGLVTGLSKGSGATAGARGRSSNIASGTAIHRYFTVRPATIIRNRTDGASLLQSPLPAGRA